MKEVTANILKLEQDNCSERSLHAMFSDKCYALTINIQISVCVVNTRQPFTVKPFTFAIVKSLNPVLVMSEQTGHTGPESGPQHLSGLRGQPRGRGACEEAACAAPVPRSTGLGLDQRGGPASWELVGKGRRERTPKACNRHLGEKKNLFSGVKLAAERRPSFSL